MMQKLFPQGMTAEDKAAVAEGVKHFNGFDHDKSICPACAIKTIHAQWVKDNKK